MINKLNIKKFGLFEDYKWDKDLGAGTPFKKLNILYGRNYSGKTTLSRIIRCLEKKTIHLNYAEDADFQILVENEMVNHNAIGSVNDEISIKVYNTDFISENLSWLHNTDGSIQPFTVLGEINKEIEERIIEIDKGLGSIESKHGLLYELELLTNKHDEAYQKYEEDQIELNDKLKQKAVNIKGSSWLYGKTNYFITHLKQDIPDANDTDAFTDQEIESKRAVLKEEIKPNMPRLKEANPSFKTYEDETYKLISKKIQLSESITDLINNSILQEWVRSGIDKHKDIRATCAFCGNVISKDLWVKLDKHFSKESEILRNDIDEYIKTLEVIRERLIAFWKLTKDNFYLTLQDKFISLNDEWRTSEKIFLENIDYLISKLKERKNDIFNEKKLDKLEDVSSILLTIIKKTNRLIDENNLKASTLIEDQSEIKEELRLSEVSRFLKEIDYKKRVENNSKLEIKYTKIAKEQAELNNKIHQLNTEKADLLLKGKDESKGANLVNEYLLQFFGHNELRLEATGEKPNIKFKITRDGKDVRNLSEGECSLISFCYFMAKIKDALQDPVNAEKLVIYIDDPISSLDNNHIFFMFSLIESLIAKPKKYRQLFISTHNLDFLKYLKRLTSPDGRDSKSIGYFLIERQQKKFQKRSFISEMPSHIREYVTEFHYLFHQIYNIHKEVKGDKPTLFGNTYSQLYNLPNNMRKFLECYLFYKYPNTLSPLDNLDKLFDGSIPALINRVVQEYSHLTSLERGWKPIDFEEAEECAKLIIQAIEKKDKPQFDALCQSIGVVN